MPHQDRIRSQGDYRLQKAARFPSGWLVVVLLAGNGALWAVMFFGTLAHLQALAGGAAPFDIRPLGYSYEEARSLLAATASRAAPITLAANSFLIPSIRRSNDPEVPCRECPQR
jgi:hypothetical protein